MNHQWKNILRFYHKRLPSPFTSPFSSYSFRYSYKEPHWLQFFFREAYYDWFHHGLTKKKNPLPLPMVSTWSHPSSVQFCSVTQLSLTLCKPMDCSTPGFPVHHQLPEPSQTHVHPIGDVIQPSHPLSSPSPPTFNLSQHQGLFKLVSSWHQVAKVMEFQLQHQSFQWIFRTDFL